MREKVRALVLSVNDYQEYDVMLQVISKDHGFLSLVGKGAKKYTAKQHFLALCLYDFFLDLKEGKTIYTITGSELVDSFYEDKDFSFLHLKNILAESALKMKEDYDRQFYDNLIFAYSHMKQGDYLLPSMFFSYLCKIHGIAPYVDGCCLCGAKKVVAISKEKGGFLCEEHLFGEKTKEKMELKKFRLLNKAGFEHYELLVPFEIYRNDFCNLVDFFETNSGIYLKSYHFFCSLF